jgi:hypothetical protein
VSTIIAMGNGEDISETDNHHCIPGIPAQLEELVNFTCRAV